MNMHILADSLETDDSEVACKRTPNRVRQHEQHKKSKAKKTPSVEGFGACHPSDGWKRGGLTVRCRAPTAPTLSCAKARGIMFQPHLPFPGMLVRGGDLWETKGGARKAARVQPHTRPALS